MHTWPNIYHYIVHLNTYAYIFITYAYIFITYSLHMLTYLLHIHYICLHIYYIFITYSFHHIDNFFIPLFLYHIWKIPIVTMIVCNPLNELFVHSTFCMQGQLGLKIIIYWGPLCSQSYHNLDVWHMLLMYVFTKLM
jgi:hypothetical protein